MILSVVADHAVCGGGVEYGFYDCHVCAWSHLIMMFHFVVIKMALYFC